MKVVTLVLVWLMMVSGPAFAAIYRWTDAQGNVHFSDKPHPGARRIQNLPPLETYSPPHLPPVQHEAQTGSNGQSGSPPRDHYQTLRLTQPRPKETFRSAERKVSVSVKAEPSLDLKRGDRLVYYLDGSRIAGPTTSTEIVLHDINRGTHAVAAAVVNSAGNELVRSVPVTFYMKPPIANHNTPAFHG